MFTSICSRFVFVCLRTGTLSLAALTLFAVASASTVEFAVNAGGTVASPFVADAFFAGGGTFSSGSTINTGGVTDPAPQAVYQSERYGNYTYTFPGLNMGENYRVRLHFAETFHSTTGQRRFNVLINGTQVLTNFDIVAEAGGQNIAIIKEFTVPANASGQIIVQFQNGPADNAKCSGIEIVKNWAPIAPTANLNFDIDSGSSYTGTAAAPDTGTFWNAISSQSTSSFTLSNVRDSGGRTTIYDVTISSSGGDIRTWNDTSLGNPNPSALMSDYTWGHTYTVTLSELPAGNYFLYVYAHGDQANQNSTVTVAAANGGASGTTGATGTEYRNLSTTGAEGYSYLRFATTVGASGTLSFSAVYLNGFQLMEYPKPVITTDLPPGPSAVVGGSFILTVEATGEGTLTYRWRKGGVNLSNGATGNGSTYSGVTTQTLTLTNVQAGDAGNYDVVVTNPGGGTVSSTASLSISATPQAPAIVTELSNKTVLATQTATFGIIANGTTPITYAWSKGGVPLANGTTANGSVLSGANTPNLSIANAALADAGAYSVTATNAVGSDSSAATLTVNKAPTIVSQPVSAIVNSGLTHTLSATFGAASPAPTYLWEKSSDGITYATVSGATGSSLGLTASLATSGFYRVVATNSIGTVTSSVIYFGVPSTQSVTFAPGNNATAISIDQQLRLVFPSAPKLGLAGALRIHDSVTNAVVATIDRSQFIGYTLFSGTIINAAKQTLQGKAMYYLPMAVYGNEVWVTLSAAQRLAYGKTYYVTMDAGLLIDSNNAAVPAIVSPTAWRFSTKSSGPATPTASTGPTTLTVGLDGTGDFATIQGAADWLPQNNTLPRTVRVKPGVYRDTAYFGQNRNFVTLVGDGASREDVQLIHLYAAEVYGDGARGMGTLRIDTNDVTVRDMTIDNLAYVAQPNLAGGFAPPAPAFAGPINTVATTGNRLVFDNVLIKGGQDTLYTITGIAYFYNCEIWGSVDFIYGDALGVFDQCDIVQIRSTGGPIGAPSTPYAQPYGEVFLNCRFPRALVANGYPYDVGTANTTFMRPWRQDGATAAINCQLGTHFTTKAWGEWDGREVTSRSREYGSTMIGGGVTTTPAQRQTAGAYWLNTIDPDYTNASMQSSAASLAPATGTANRVAVNYNAADWTLAAIFGHPYFNLNGWLPSLAPRISSQPASRSVAAGQSVTFTVVGTGTPAPGYQWFKNGVAISGATSASYTIASPKPADSAGYSVVLSNSASSVTSATAVLNVTSPLLSWASGYGLDAEGAGFTAADADGDGIPNLLEYLFDGDPTVADPGVLPSASVVSDSGGKSLVLEYDRLITAAAELLVTVVTSTDLAAWGTVTAGNGGVTEQTTVLDAEREHVQVTIPFSGTRLFARVSASM